MDRLTYLIEKGVEIRKTLSDSHKRYADKSFQDEISIWKNQGIVYIDTLKVSKFIKAKFNTEAINIMGIADIDLKHIDEMLNILKALLPQDEEIHELDKKQNKTKSNKVFVVHGHNKGLRDEVKSVLLELGLRPVILSEQANGGKTIIEKFEENSGDVNYAIILITADDEGKAVKDKEYKLRARQNVILEMGYFMSSLKRSNVFLLLEDKIELPSDINGVGYASVHDNWKIMLVKELRNCGYQVTADDLN